MTIFADLESVPRTWHRAIQISAKNKHPSLAPKHHNSKASRLNPIQVAKDIWTKLPAEAISQNLVLFKHSIKTSQTYELLSKKVEAVRRMEEAI
uniref:Transposase n=1 Tax=Acrobeloides nanus TaxID=290746 RepID=A0A914DPL6_9BILA